jgi:hypothetical protein
MRRSTLVLLAAVACGGNTTPPDAGPMIDTSCGIDCAAQERYGLIAGRCFEYSSSTSAMTQPALAAEVKPKRELEGGIPVMDVTYTELGQRRMQDSFTIVNGELKLVRREFGVGGTSASYKKTTGELEGVKWLASGTGAGENFSTTSSADVVTPGGRKSEETTYRVTTSAPGASDLRFPIGTYDAGVRLLISETPDHGSDSRRTWVPGVGFPLITTPLMLTGGTPLEYQLQNIKDTPDAGQCGF